MSERYRLLLRASAVMMLLGALPLFVAAIQPPRDADPSLHPNIAEPAMLLLLCIGTSAALWAFSLMPTSLRQHPQDVAAAEQLQEDVAGMFVRMDEMAASVEQLSRIVRQLSLGVAPDSGDTQKAVAAGHEVISRLERSLSEIRELAMLTERERQAWRDLSQRLRPPEAMEAAGRAMKD
jgi:hypothetical protein